MLNALRMLSGERKCLNEERVFSHWVSPLGPHKVLSCSSCIKSCYARDTVCIYRKIIKFYYTASQQRHFWPSVSIGNVLESSDLANASIGAYAILAQDPRAARPTSF